MPLIASIRRALLLACASLAACSDDDARRHVYQSPPPSSGLPRSPRVNASPEPPVGSFGPSARITGVRLASTGVPVALDQLTETVLVTALVSRGRGSSPAGPAHVELRITGAADTTLAVPFRSPVPFVVAHDFPVVVGRRASGLPGGRFLMQVRLLGPSGRLLAASIPVPIRVRTGEH